MTLRSGQRRSFLMAALGLAAGGCASGSRHGAGAQISDHAGISDLVQHAILRQQRAYSAVVAIADRSGRRFLRAAAAGRSRPDSDTIFEIASLTKVFTALLLAEAATRGRVRLDDPLQAYLPPGVQAPEFEGRPITLADLATHSSGLPLRPNNLAASAPDAPDKYAGYTLEQLYAGLSDYALSQAPGTRFQYSNLGFGLLGQSLAAASGYTFDELLRRRVTDPLRLKDTAFGEDLAKANRRAQGHDFDFNPVCPSGESALNPAAGLRSTASDLLTFLELFLEGAGPAGLGQAARHMLAAERPGDNPETHMVLGWRRTVAHGETYYWSNGSGDGSRTFMGFNPRRRVGVVALADTASGGGLDDIGRRVLDPLHAVDTAIVPRLPTIALPEELLARALGVYVFAPGDQIAITRGMTGLILTAGVSQIVIQPQSTTRYVSSMAPGVTVDFEGADTGPAVALLLHQDGQTYRYERVS